MKTKTLLLSLLTGACLLWLSGCAVLIPFVQEQQAREQQVLAAQQAEEAARLAVINPPPVHIAASSEERPFHSPAAGNDATGNNYVISGRRAKSDQLYRQLVRQLKNPDPAKRTCAATDLSRLNRSSGDLIPHLVRALRTDNSKWVRRAAVKSLGRIGTRAVIAPLTAALNDRDRWVAHSAANALQGVRTRIGQTNNSYSVASL
jgi:hypothetical protein